jgi:glucose/arabinose dehydrogenase
MQDASFWEERAMRAIILCAAALALAACGQHAATAPTPAGDYAVGFGPNPILPEPNSGIAPTVNAAKGVGWPEGGAPTPAAGFAVTRYAEGLNHPRWLYRLPNGDVLVAQASSTPARNQGVMGWVRNQVMARAGALEDESPDVITLLRDSDGDGVVDQRATFKDNLNQPIGMALVGSDFFIGNTDGLAKFHYTPGATALEGDGDVILKLPTNPGANGHWTRNVVANADGTKLYVSVGSATNIGDAGMDIEEGRAAIWEVAPDGSGARIFASGIRNPVGLDFEPVTGALWVATNERDGLGDDLVPDYITSVKDGAFYGWPYSYYGQHVDMRVEPQNAELVASAIAPDYAMGAHTACLGLHFYRGDALSAHYRGGAFVGQHGSWNRSVRAGYKVVFVPFTDGRPSAPPEDFLTGFLNAKGEAQGRPVGVIEDRTGAILVADDVGGVVWRVAPASP